MMKIKLPLLLIFLFALDGSLVAQETELDMRNGFKDIKMASNIDSVKGIKFKKDIKVKGHPAKIYTIEHPDYLSIGEVVVDEIEVKTYKGLIFEILVITDKDTRLMKGMESALGKPIYNVRDESYNWSGLNLGLKFKSHSKNQLQLLYSSTVVYKIMLQDKAKKIEDISDDF